MKLLALASAFCAFVCSIQTQAAAEPAFCDPARFASFERTPNVEGVKRLHMFKIGGLWLSGLAVGNSDVAPVQALAQSYGKAPSSQNSCTWYLNDGNGEAAQAFNQRYVDRPTSNIERSVSEYDSVLSSIFDRDQVNIVSCARKHGYVALGCNGMKHRGPTGFAMVLAFAGCSPRNAVTIANKLWGSNGVPTETRLAIAKSAYELGEARASSRRALQRVMLTSRN